VAKVTQPHKEPRIKQIQWSGLTWIDIQKPTSEETAYLGERYTFLFVILHFPRFNKEARVTIASQVALFIGNDYLITLHSGELKPLVKLFRDCELREEAREEIMKSSAYLLYRIVDRLVDYCFPILSKIMGNIDTVEDEIFDGSGRGPVKEISFLRRDIIAFRRIIWPLRAVVASLEHRTERFTKQDLEVYWGDVVDHMDKIWDTLDECKEIVEGLSDTSNSLYSHRTSEVMRVLTIITTIMLPLTVVTGFFGMNVLLPGGRENSSGYWPLLVLIIIMVAEVLGMLAFFRYRKWI
jgi:magnesium transporter